MWHYYLMGEISGCKGEKSSEDGQLMDLQVAFQWVCHLIFFFLVGILCFSFLCDLIFMCTSVCLCVCASCACSASRDQKRALDPLGLELESCWKALRTEPGPRASGKEASAPNFCAISPAPGISSCSYFSLGT